MELERYLKGLITRILQLSSMKYMITKPPTTKGGKINHSSVFKVFTFVGSRPPQYSWPAAATPNHDEMLSFGWMID